MPRKKKTSAAKKTKKWTRTQLKTKALPIRSVVAPMHPTAAVENDLPFLGRQVAGCVTAQARLVAFEAAQ